MKPIARLVSPSVLAFVLALRGWLRANEARSRTLLMVGDASPPWTR